MLWWRKKESKVVNQPCYTLLENGYRLQSGKYHAWSDLQVQNLWDSQDIVRAPWDVVLDVYGEMKSRGLNTGSRDPAFLGKIGLIMDIVDRPSVYGDQP